MRLLGGLRRRQRAEALAAQMEEVAQQDARERLIAQAGSDDRDPRVASLQAPNGHRRRVGRTATGDGSMPVSAPLARRNASRSPPPGSED